MTELDPTLLQRLSQASPTSEDPDLWPRDQFNWLARAGVLGWVIPREYGGSGISSTGLIAGYEQLATACMVTTFVLTQRNGACQRIAGAEHGQSLRDELLPPLARGELFATVGISHLTTSRQHLAQPAVQARSEGGDWILSGTIPWVTGAPHADYVVTGGTTGDGRQILIALPTALPGVTCQPPGTLLSLTSSCTSSIGLQEVRVPGRALLAGPVDGVMTRGEGGGTGSVATSSLAVGLSERAVRVLENEARRRDDLQPVATSFRQEVDALRTDLLATATGHTASGGEPCTTEEIRRRSNSLVLRSTQAALTATKGAGFVRGHPVEHAVREALFFLVWSCPRPVASAALHEFACLES